MGLNDAAKMRKSAAIVGEVIGKYHPHGDQAAYEALVRMAQDFSLRYPLIEGLGNFGSLDGDSPAAMRYTETRLSSFASALLKEINQGTTQFRPTYDGMGEEPDVLPAGVPNLLLNGSSGIAVGMSCSFAPHNLTEVIAACRATISDMSLGTEGLLKYIKGPDFPTGGEILDQPESLAAMYRTGHGSIRLRGTYEVEQKKKGQSSLIITSIPYSVNKSRLIERIAILIKEKNLKHVQDIRDESTADVRIVVELKGDDVKPDSVMAFLYKHTDLQINFPVNMIAVTPSGVPDRLSLEAIIRHFLEFRYDKTVLRLQHRLETIRKRIHVLEGFELLFRDLDKAIRIIRSARNRGEAEEGLASHFHLDKEQVDAVLEMRLYRLVGMEIGKLLDELAAKRREERDISRDLSSPDRIWKIVDRDLTEIQSAFGEARRTRFVTEEDASAVAFDPDEFVQHEDATVILSKQGWIRRMKMEVGDASSLKFREGDGLFGWVRVNTGRTVAIFSNLGKVYIMRAIDIPATSGFGEPIGSLLTLADGEFMVGLIAPDPARDPHGAADSGSEVEGASRVEERDEDPSQPLLFRELDDENGRTESYPDIASSERAILITRGGKGFRFGYEILREPTKRNGKKLVNIRSDDEVVSVKPEDRESVAIAVDSGRVLFFPVDQVPMMAGPAQGVRMIGLKAGSSVIGMELVSVADSLRIEHSGGKEQILSVGQIPKGNRGSRGKTIGKDISRIDRIEPVEVKVQ
jgi:DNA gyrase subunit A